MRVAVTHGAKSKVLLALGWAGFLAHLGTLMLYAASGLLAPGWAVAVLMVFWVANTVAAWRLLKTRPGWVLGVPVLDAVVWFGVLTLGENVLGWTG